MRLVMILLFENGTSFDKQRDVSESITSEVLVTCLTISRRYERCCKGLQCGVEVLVVCKICKSNEGNV
jgi:hypothetical protein